MSSSTPRKSIDSFDSILSPLSQRSAYPFPSHDSSQRYGAESRYRRGSSASISSLNSVANSIGGSLDIQTGRNSSAVRETGQNGMNSRMYMDNTTETCSSHIEPLTATNCQDRPTSTCVCLELKPEAAHYQRHTSRHAHEHSTCRTFGVQRLPDENRATLRKLPTRTSRKCC